MLQIIRGTTPTIEINVKSDIDLSTVDVIWIYISQQKQVKVDKQTSDVSFDVQEKKIFVTLSQDDTLALKADVDTLFQIRILLTNGTALATIASDVTVREVYKEGVIEEG